MLENVEFFLLVEYYIVWLIFWEGNVFNFLVLKFYVDIC